MSLAALIVKDLRVEWRARDVLAGTVTLAGLVALAGYVAFLEAGAATRALAGVLWIGVVFAAQVGLARSFVVERERGTLEGVLASPASPFALWGAKLVLHAVVVFVVGLVLLAALWVLFAPAAAPRPAHLGVLALGTLGVTLLTTLTAAVAMHGRNWVLLVPLLSLPALFPVLAAGVRASGLLLDGAPLASAADALRVLVAYDVVLLVLAWLLVPYLVEP